MTLDRVIRELAQGEDEPQAYEAVVAKTATTPSQDLEVSVPSFDGTHLFNAIGWAPRVVPGSPPTTLLPQEGDRALVVSSDEGETWCLCWWPASYD